MKKEPIDLFYQAMKGKAEATAKDYETKLKKVLCEFLKTILKGDPKLVAKQETEPAPNRRGVKRKFYDADFKVRANEFVERARQDPEWTEVTMLTLVEKLGDRTKLPKDDPNYLKPISIKNYLIPVQKLFEMNRIIISWKLIRSPVPEIQEKDDSRGYTYEEIEKMLHFARKMDRVIILLAASSGIRAGAFVFKWKDLFPAYQYQGRYLWEEEDVTESVTAKGQFICAMIRIYGESRHEYFAFITPECWKAIEEYRNSWIREVGHPPKPDDPFFKKSGPFAIELSEMGIRKRLERILTDSGIRTILPKGKRRYEVPAFNGFRRFFNKANKKSLSRNSLLASLILKETMMGHAGLIRLDKSYFKEHIDELIEEYILAIPNLTISNEERQKIKIQKLEKEKPTDEKLVKMVKVLNKKFQIAEYRLTKTLEVVEQIAKNNPSVSLSWDKTKSFHYPDDDELAN